MSKKHIYTHLLSLGILVAGFLISVLLMAERNGIGGTGKMLALFALLTIICSFLMGGKLIPLITSSGYFLSFLAALIFQRDRMDPGGCHTNNFEGIFIIVFFACFILSLFFESVYANKKLHN